MRKNIVAAVVGLGLAAAVTPRPASASAYGTLGSLTTYCNASVSGSLSVCAAVSASYSSGLLTLKVWNLFGQTAGSGSVYHAITAMGIYSAGWKGSATLTSATYQGNPVAWTVAGAQDIVTWGPGGVGAKLDIRGGTNGVGQAVVGCGGPSTSPPYTTCNYPNTPYLTLVFSLTNANGYLNADQYSDWAFRWHSQDVNGIGSGCSLRVDSHQSPDVSDPAYASGCSVVPEPVTMLLLGSGLAGMGGFGLVRRRKHNGDIEST